jgi:hypothetical protein
MLFTWSYNIWWELSQDIDYRSEGFGDFPQSFKANVGLVPRFGHNRFLPNLFQIVIHQ